MRYFFKFDGVLEYYDKKGNLLIQYNRKGVSGKEAFHAYDSTGKIKPTKHPNLLRTLLKSKGSCNFHIKLYAEDRASGLFPLIEFRGLCIKYKTPPWFREAVEAQKYKYYKYD